MGTLNPASTWKKAFWSSSESRQYRKHFGRATESPPYPGESILFMLLNPASLGGLLLVSLWSLGSPGCLLVALRGLLVLSGFFWVRLVGSRGPVVVSSPSGLLAVTWCVLVVVVVVVSVAVVF